MTLGRKWQLVLRSKVQSPICTRTKQVTLKTKKNWNILGQVVRGYWVLWLPRKHLFLFTWESHFSAPTNCIMQENKSNTAVSSNFSSDINLDLCVELAIRSKQFKTLGSSTVYRQNQMRVNYIRPLGYWPLTELIPFQTLCQVLEYILGPKEIDKKTDDNCKV